jgi:Domain of unknown function (DUF4258)
MSETLTRVQHLVSVGEVRISDHGYEEFAADGILAREVLAGVSVALVVEAYPDAARGPSVLVVRQDRNGDPIHVLWGIPAGKTGPPVVITSYRPDPERWSDNFRRRKTQ